MHIKYIQVDYLLKEANAEEAKKVALTVGMAITERRAIARIFVDCFSVGDIAASGHAAPSAIDIRFFLNDTNKNSYVGNDVEVVEA